MATDFNQNDSTSCLLFVNLSSPDDADTMLYSDVERWLYLTFTPVILFFGLLTNLTFIYVVYKIPAMQNITNCYFVNLACADMLFLTFSTTEKITAYLVSPIRDDMIGRGTFGCVLPEMIVLICFFTSIFFVTLVTFERFYAICWPLRHHVISTWSRTIKLTFTTWSFATVCAGFSCIGYSKYIEICLVWPDTNDYSQIPSRMGYCVGIKRWTTLIFPVMFTSILFLAFISNSIMCVSIVHKLHKRTKVLKLQGNYDKSVETRNSIARMLIVNSTVFFVCQAPYQVSNLFNLISGMIAAPDEDFQTRKTSGIAITLLLYLNSIVNPIIFSLTNTQYRRAFIEAVCVCKEQKLDSQILLEQNDGNIQDKPKIIEDEYESEC